MTIKDEQGADRPQCGQDETVPADLARRRFAKSGLAVSGVLMTLTAQPVLSQVCTTPSVSASANLSRHGPVIICNGQSPLFWSLKSWSLTGTSPTALFSSEFTGGANYTSMTLHDVVAYNTDKSKDLGKYLVAALLNTRSGRTPFLKVETIKAMYSELLAPPTYYFYPTAGVPWRVDQVISYLKSTQV